MAAGGLSGLEADAAGLLPPCPQGASTQAVPGSCWGEVNSCRPGPNVPAVANERVCYVICV